MQLPIQEIETRLRSLGVPEQQILAHIDKLSRWRVSHPKKIKRKRLWDDDDDIGSAGVTVQRPKRRYVGTQAIFRRKPRKAQARNAPSP